MAKFFLRFAPKEDITAYELALALKLYITSKEPYTNSQKEFYELPESAKRHFVVSFDS